MRRYKTEESEHPSKHLDTRDCDRTLPTSSTESDPRLESYFALASNQTDLIPQQLTSSGKFPRSRDVYRECRTTTRVLQRQ